jgi:hypothetical protein
VSLREGDRNRALSRINRAVSASAVAMPPKQKRKPAHKGAKKGRVIEAWPCCSQAPRADGRTSTSGCSVL